MVQWEPCSTCGKKVSSSGANRKAPGWRGKLEHAELDGEVFLGILADSFD
jgi:hypothetical protein